MRSTAVTCRTSETDLGGVHLAAAYEAGPVAGGGRIVGTVRYAGAPPARGTLEVTKDNIMHSIHNYSLHPEAPANPPLNRAQPKFKTAVTETFAAPEIPRVGCDVHRWMQAWIVVVDDPYYAVTDTQGEFVLVDVPPGGISCGSGTSASGRSRGRFRSSPGRRRPSPSSCPPTDRYPGCAARRKLPIMRTDFRPWNDSPRR